MLLKQKANNIFTLFLISHLLLWILIPSISNKNLPLDVIEAITWGDGWPLGWEKHPPLSSWFPELFYQIFGNQDWVYYLLSQLFIVTSFIVVWLFSLDFFKNKIHSLIAVLLLESIFFYNFTTPEFNVNVCQLPFWALSVYYCWKGIKQNDYINWLLFGLFAALGILSKYLFIYLLFAVDIFFIYLIFKKKFNYKCLISLVSFIIILIPHLIWLVDNDFITIFYALHRTGIENSDFLTSHLYNPFIFLGKQIGILIPFFVLFFLLVSKFKIKLNFKDKKLIFLLCINIIPLVLIFLTSFFLGAKIRTMWMTPFYLYIGVLFVYIFQKKIVIKKIKYFFSMFLLLFILSPAAYFYVSISQTDKRTDYPGEKISQVVQNKWESNFSDKIGLIGGDVWHGGNLIYHLEGRPKWDNILENKEAISFKDIEGGFVLIGNSEILLKICSGVFFEVENQGVCMAGKKK